MRSAVRSRRPVSPRLAALALVALVTLSLVGLGCRRLTGSFPNTGSYPADVFTEMHYQQNFRSQESPRLASSLGAVPITGRDFPYTPGQYAALENPTPITPQAMAGAAELYRVNCSMCHGAAGRGDGKVGDILVANNYGRPPDLTAGLTANHTDGEIFGLISEGLFVMPKWKLLLNEQDRWLLVSYLRQLQGR
ncbi:MAG: cytochrome c [Dehalococcoidia bacterium]|nr:cytochrome c [Dehalococcoidia bacterium]